MTTRSLALVHVTDPKFLGLRFSCCCCCVGSNITKMIIQTCFDYRILNKVISISLDNTTNNDSAMTILKNILNIMLDGILFHIRCICHILNLCVQERYKKVDDLISIIRNITFFIKTFLIRTQNFNVSYQE
jgi:hypothetical protein